MVPHLVLAGLERLVQVLDQPGEEAVVDGFSKSVSGIQGHFHVQWFIYDLLPGFDGAVS